MTIQHGVAAAATLICGVWTQMLADADPQNFLNVQTDCRVTVDLFHIAVNATDTDSILFMLDKC